ncbi:Ig-like domain-containing protein [Halobellus sp. H-GB7]|uniref:Ig-like domain-containing protein n=1 Tax=Halobellus sp. H-GB7 TaxID=3069756 RepID=UPI0027B3DEA2|nr:Ig-like domain-containing protein [Halobellus sp. H-GB7]MDQ2055515.1 Ig-like domain-containing protein [Halobellus sp. H-GB7]
MSSVPKLWAVMLSLMIVSSTFVGVVAFSGTVDAATTTSQLDFSSIYNQDVVYGTKDTTDGDFDGGDRSLPSSSAAVAEGRSSDYGLPDDGVFAAETDVHPKFDLADFNSDDSNAWQTTGTGSKTAPVTNDKYETVHVIASAGGAGVGSPAKFEVKLHYDDGSTETSQEFTAPDWYNNSYNPSGVYFLRNGMDRYSSANGYQNENDPAIWGYAVSANASKTLTEVTINVTENQADAFNFFGGAATTQTSTETNSAPSASDDSASTDEDTSVTVDVVSNDTDPDGDNLDVDTIVNLPSHGTAKITGSSSDKIEFTPGTDKNSDVDITYRVKDGNGGTDTATLSVTVNAIDDAPTVPDDSSQSTDEDSTVSVPDGDSADLLELASDPDAGDTLTISKIDGKSFSDGKTVTLGSGATVAVYSNGSWSYNPNGQFEALGSGDSSTDSYTYAIQDTDGDSNQGTVTVTINGRNDAPVAVASSNATSINDGNAVAFDATGSSDVDGDTLTYDWDVDGDGADEYTDSVKPEHTYTQTGSYTVTLTADDGSAMTTDTLTITVRDGTPTNPSSGGGDGVSTGFSIDEQDTETTTKDGEMQATITGYKIGDTLSIPTENADTNTITVEQVNVSFDMGTNAPNDMKIQAGAKPPQGVPEYSNAEQTDYVSITIDGNLADKVTNGEITVRLAEERMPDDPSVVDIYHTNGETWNQAERTYLGNNTYKIHTRSFSTFVVVVEHTTEQTTTTANSAQTITSTPTPTVTEPATSIDMTTKTTSASTTTGTSTPGFGIVLAFVSLLGGALLLRRR